MNGEKSGSLSRVRDIEIYKNLERHLVIVIKPSGFANWYVL